MIRTRFRPHLLVSLLCASALAVSACGSAHQVSHPIAGQTAAATATDSTTAGLLGDEDADSAGHASYLDADDGSVSEFGHPADAAEAGAVRALVGSYYAAAAAADGARACALLYYLLAESLAEEYGRPPGPLYLKGASTCPVLLTRVFQHFHAKLATPPRVTAVRVSGESADALIGWTSLPAGFIEARREGAAWKLAHPLAAPLP